MKEIKYKVINSEATQNILLACGIYPTKKGYNYLLAAIDTFRGPTNGLCNIYKHVANMYEVSPYSVERCIRSCLNEAFFVNSFVYLNKFFKTEIVKKETYLASGDFIGIIAAYLDMINAPAMEFIPIDEKKE